MSSADLDAFKLAAEGPFDEAYFERVAELGRVAEPADLLPTWAGLAESGAQALRPPDRSPAPAPGPGVWLSDVALEPEPPFLVDPFWPAAPTILFGPGGVGKGLIAAWWVSSMTVRGERVAILDFEGNVEEWSGRIGRIGGDLSKVLYIAGNRPIWDIARPIAGQFDSLAADGHGISAAVIDSATTACGSGSDSDVSGPETVTRYKQALALLGVPTLTLAHVTKAQAQSGEPARYPFGSVFWHNLARMTWAIVHAGSETDHTMRLVNQKASRWQRHPDVFIKADWGEDRITIMPLGQPEGGALWQRMDAILEAEGPLTPKELGARLKVEDNHVRSEIATHSAKFIKTGDKRKNADLWRPRRGPDDTGGPDPQGPAQASAWSAGERTQGSDPPVAGPAPPVPVEDDYPASAWKTDEEE